MLNFYEEAAFLIFPALFYAPNQLQSTNYQYLCGRKQASIYGYTANGCLSYFGLQA